MYTKILLMLYGACVTISMVYFLSLNLPGITTVHFIVVIHILIVTYLLNNKVNIKKISTCGLIFMGYILGVIVMLSYKFRLSSIKHGYVVIDLGDIVTPFIGMAAILITFIISFIIFILHYFLTKKK